MPEPVQQTWPGWRRFMCQGLVHLMLLAVKRRALAADRKIAAVALQLAGFDRVGKAV